MSGLNSIRCLRSWMPPSSAWTIVLAVFCIEVPVDDSEIVEFISTRTCEVNVFSTKRTEQVLAAFIGKELFRGQLGETVWAPAKLNFIVPGICFSRKVVAPRHGVVLLHKGGYEKLTGPD
jgi:hypothetical protein